MENEKKIQALYQTFKVLGKVEFKVNTAEPKKNWSVDTTNDNGYKYVSCRFKVKTNDGISLPVELMGGYYPNKPTPIKTTDKDRNKMEINFEDRLDKEILSTVNEMRLRRANLIDTEYDNSQLFLHDYDFAKYIKENLKSGQIVIIKGSIKKEKYFNDKTKQQVTNTKYIIEEIRLMKEDAENFCEATVNFIIDKDSIDKEDYKTEGKIYVNGFVTYYANKDLGNQFISNTFIIDKNHIRNIIASKMECKTEEEISTQVENNINVLTELLKIKDEKYYVTQWTATPCVGNEIKTMTKDDLTKEQLLFIDMGLITEEEAIKQLGGNTFGDRVNELKLIVPTMKLQDVDKDDKKVVKLATDYVEDDFVIKDASTGDKKDLYKENKQEDDTSDVGDMSSLLSSLGI